MRPGSSLARQNCTAASRLAQMLQAAVHAERQALLSAAERLDRLLSDIGIGKELSPELKRQQK